MKDRGKNVRKSAVYVGKVQSEAFYHFEAIFDKDISSAAISRQRLNRRFQPLPQQRLLHKSTTTPTEPAQNPQTQDSATPYTDIRALYSKPADGRNS